MRTKHVNEAEAIFPPSPPLPLSNLVLSRVGEVEQGSTSLLTNLRVVPVSSQDSGKKRDAASLGNGELHLRVSGHVL